MSDAILVALADGAHIEFDESGDARLTSPRDAIAIRRPPEPLRAALAPLQRR